jgi:hypothetical protein
MTKKIVCLSTAALAFGPVAQKQFLKNMGIEIRLQVSILSFYITNQSYTRGSLMINLMITK